MGVLDGKAAIVTGSARGIGRATAELLAEQGAKVLINDLDGDVAEEASNEIQGETVAFAGDLTKDGVPDKLVETAVEAFGQLDIIVNNAGYTWDGPIHKMGDDQFQAMLDIHTIVPFRVLRAAAPHLREPAKKERDERSRGVPQGRERLLDLGHDGQRRPGQLLVGQGRRRRPDQDARQGVGPVQDQRERGRLRLRRDAPDRLQGGGRDLHRRTARRSSSASPSRCARWHPMIIPLGRPATPEEAAGPVFYLCSPWSNYVHGQVLNVTGGQFGGMTT